jgi:hypothetical protein
MRMNYIGGARGRRPSNERLGERSQSQNDCEIAKYPRPISAPQLATTVIKAFAIAQSV